MVRISLRKRGAVDHISLHLLTRWTRAAALLLAAAMPLVAGCEKDAGSLPPNVTPTTYLHVQGADLDTVEYRQILHWWGSDPDGSVIGYCIRWDGEWQPPAEAIRCAFDESFIFTTATTDTFVVPIGGAYGERTFSVHAVDDDRNVDLEGNSQRFKLFNRPPELAWSSEINRPVTSLPAVSFAWTFEDLDGPDTVIGFRYWLDGNDPDTLVTADTMLTLGVDDFDERFGERTLFVQALDEALAKSNVLTHTWTVERPPQQRYLLIDNVSSGTPGAATEDGYYRNLLDAFAGSDYFVYDVETRGDFRSGREAAALFSLFDGVLWYGGDRSAENDASARGNLARAESDILTYLDQGGNVLLMYRDAIGDGGALSQRFVSDVLGVEQYFRDASESTQFEISSDTELVTELVAAPQNTLRTIGSSFDADFFLIRGGAEPLFWVEPGYFDSTVTPDQSDRRAFLGVSADHEDGRIAVATFLLSRADGLGNASTVGTALLQKIFAP